MSEEDSASGKASVLCAVLVSNVVCRPLCGPAVYGSSIGKVLEKSVQESRKSLGTIVAPSRGTGGIQRTEVRAQDTARDDSAVPRGASNRSRCQSQGVSLPGLHSAREAQVVSSVHASPQVSQLSRHAVTATAAAHSGCARPSGRPLDAYGPSQVSTASSVRGEGRGTSERAEELLSAHGTGGCCKRPCCQTMCGAVAEWSSACHTRRGHEAQAPAVQDSGGQPQVKHRARGGPGQHGVSDKLVVTGADARLQADGLVGTRCCRPACAAKFRDIGVMEFDDEVADDEEEK